MATTQDLRTNIIIRYNGVLHRVVEFHHHAPGNWRAMVILKLKNVQTGKVIEDRVRAGSDIEIVRVDKRPMQYLYRDGDSYHFMDNETFEQIEIPGDTIGDPAKYMKESEIADVLFYDDNQILGCANVRHAEGDRGQHSLARRHRHECQQAGDAGDRRDRAGAGVCCRGRHHPRRYAHGRLHRAGQVE